VEAGLLQLRWKRVWLEGTEAATKMEEGTSTNCLGRWQLVEESTSVVAWAGLLTERGQAVDVWQLLDPREASVGFVSRR